MLKSRATRGAPGDCAAVGHSRTESVARCDTRRAWTEQLPAVDCCLCGCFIGTRLVYNVLADGALRAVAHCGAVAWAVGLRGPCAVVDGERGAATPRGHRRGEWRERWRGSAWVRGFRNRGVPSRFPVSHVWRRASRVPWRTCRTCRPYMNEIGRSSPADSPPDCPDAGDGDRRRAAVHVCGGACAQ